MHGACALLPACVPFGRVCRGVSVVVFRRVAICGGKVSQGNVSAEMECRGRAVQTLGRTLRDRFIGVLRAGRPPLRRRPPLSELSRVDNLGKKN